MLLPFRSLRPLSVCLLLLVLCISFGCGSKKVSGPSTSPPSKSDVPRKPGGKPKNGRIPATQRPYEINGITYHPIPSAQGYAEQGLASWYGEPFHGRKTSNGEIYDMYGDTAAHKTLPMHTVLLVKNLENGKSTVVRINDRGPFVQERILDLTYAKAKELDIVGKGTAKVEIIAMAEDEEPPTVVASTPPMKSPEKPAPATTKPTAAKVKPPHVKAPTKDFDKGNFYVQVGAFVKIENARLLAKAFAKRGRDVIIQQYPAAGMNLYRVMIFASTSLAEAKNYQQQMVTEGFRYALLLAR